MFRIIIIIIIIIIYFYYYYYYYYYEYYRIYISAITTKLINRLKIIDFPCKYKILIYKVCTLEMFKVYKFIKMFYFVSKTFYFNVKF